MIQPAAAVTTGWMQLPGCRAAVFWPIELICGVRPPKNVLIAIHTWDTGIWQKQLRAILIKKLNCL
jgi:hypothetical protein